MPLLSPALVVLAHPRPDSFNHALAARIRRTLDEAGVRVRFHDLCAEGFDPLLTAEESRLTGPQVGVTDDPLVRTHRTELADARALVVVHPNWWGTPPAVLSGWLDRVLAPGLAYRDHGPDAPIEPLLRIRRLLVVNTTDTAPERERTEIGDPLDLVWRRVVAPTLGGPDVERMVLPQVGAADPARRGRWLDGAARAAAWVSGAAR